ncbi:MAG: hypothetical protein J5544_01745 [Clostridia bacterium]|nr:hypothetical protein [Clostridia bacterium]
MRKTVLIILAALLLISLAACAGKDGQPSAGQSAEPGSALDAAREDDFDNRFGQGSYNLAETEDAYYFSPPSGKYIYYYDKATGDYGVLCAKPECMHDEGNTEDCNGLADLCMKSLNNWGGKLHFVGWDRGLKRYCLFGLSYDGSEREREAELDFGEYSQLQIPYDFDYHRGMLYCYVQYDKVKGGVPGYATELFSVDPGTGKLTQIFKTEDDPDVGVDKPRLFYYNQYVYFLLSKWHYEEDDTLHIEIELRRYDTETEQVEDVYSGVMGPNGGSVFRYWVESEDRIYLMPKHCKSGNTPKLYLISDGELSVLHEFDAATAEHSVSTCLFEDAVVFLDFKDERLKVCACDGTVICDGPLDLSPVQELAADENARIRHYVDMYGDSGELFVVYTFEDRATDENSYCLVRYTFREDGAEATLLVGNARMY